MRSKISLKWSLSIITILGIAFSLIFLIVIFFLGLPGMGSYTKPASLISSQIPQAGLGLPIRLKISGISVDSTIEYVGLTSNGAMDIPKNQDDVAWYKLGPRPGETGSAVIAGHYGIKSGKPSVFDNLYKLRKGDKLYVEDEKGVIISFVVRESRTYDPTADASDVFGSNDGKAHLNLVTCEGVWNKVAKSYSKRLVVFTDKE